VHNVSVNTAPAAVGPGPGLREHLLSRVLDLIGAVAFVCEPQSASLTVAGGSGPIAGHAVDDLGVLSLDRLRSLVHPDDVARLCASCVPVLLRSEGGAFHAAEVRLRDPRGSWRWVAVQAGAWERDAGGTATTIAVLARDVHEAVLARRRAEDDLRRSRDLALVGRLAGDVAHDFNNLLTTVLGYTGMLIDEMPAEDPRRQDLVEVWRAGDRAAALARELLAACRRATAAEDEGAAADGVGDGDAPRDGVP
jgi:signal transduction histidine kinase